MQVPERETGLQDETRTAASAVGQVISTVPLRLEGVAVDRGCCEPAVKDVLSRRCLDIAVSAAILLVFGIPMLLIAAAIKLTSRGPIIYRQNRNGQNGESFAIWKFRTMSVCEADAEMRQEQPEDPRVTVLGRLLRRTSLDELPNLFNVLFGHMSLVGPRPHPIKMDEEFDKVIYGYRLRRRTKPGVTGLAQICGSRGPCTTVELMKTRVALDLYYARNASLLLDLEILWKTAVLVLTGREGYQLSDFAVCGMNEMKRELIH